MSEFWQFWLNLGILRQKGGSTDRVMTYLGMGYRGVYYELATIKTSISPSLPTASPSLLNPLST